MTLQEAIEQLRSMFEQYEHENRVCGPDMAEVASFLTWASERDQEIAFDVLDAIDEGEAQASR